MSARTRLSLAVALLCTTFTPPFVSPATAGCGCDHPPPAFTQVMPPYASPGKLVRIFADTNPFIAGRPYEVDFEGKKVAVIAAEAESLEVAMPFGVKPGPVEIKVKGEHFDYTYSRSLFTALPKAVKVPSHPGAFEVREFKGAVSADGTLLLPVDLSNVLAATQFAFSIADVPLDFGHDDVALENVDGVDLRAFTLAVEDETRRQWGSYYGWEVREDGQLVGVAYEHKVRKGKIKQIESDVLTYWRHEFQTYAAAHGAGGTHQVDARGFHPDGTYHVDHEHLVIAITGVVTPEGLESDLLNLEKHYDAEGAAVQRHADEDRSKAGSDRVKLAKIASALIGKLAEIEAHYGDDRVKLLARAKRLGAGEKKLDLRLVAIAAEHPIEPDAIVPEAYPLESLAP